jgi:hypothetical protein
MPDVAPAQGAGAVSTAESNSGAILHPIAQELDVFAPITQVPGYTASVNGRPDFRIGCCRRGVGAWACEVSGVMPHVFIFEEGCRFEPILRMVPLAPLIVMLLTRIALGADLAR